MLCLFETKNTNQIIYYEKNKITALEEIALTFRLYPTPSDYAKFSDNLINLHKIAFFINTMYVSKLLK